MIWLAPNGSALLRAVLCLCLAATVGAKAAITNELNVLFIGNSFTARHSLAHVVKALVEEGQPGTSFKFTTVIYGGRTLANHWELQTPNFIRQATISSTEVQASIDFLKRELARHTDLKPAERTQTAEQNSTQHFAAALKNQEQLAKVLKEPRRKWDVVVLQSYLDDLDANGRSPYFEFAPKYAAMARAEGARVILYETTRDTQNASPLNAAPNSAPVLAKAKVIAALATRIGADVVPMSTVALRCQTVRPDLTLRFVNDFHLNQTMAYLTACAFYGRLFNRSPVGLTFTRVTDNRFDGQQKDKDRDGGPLTRNFSSKDRTDLQRIAWEGVKLFDELAKASQ